MGIYRTVSRKVEDVFVKMLAGNQNPEIVREKVAKYRTEADQKLEAKKAEKEKKQTELERQRKVKEEQERKELEALISRVMENGTSQYELNEIKNNKQFFTSLVEKIFEPNEKALAFIFCEFDKSSSKEIKGYLLATNKRILFLTKDLSFMDKFRYQTVNNVSWFKDGVLERGMHIHYGNRKIEFDEMFDQEQMKRVGDTILKRATRIAR